MSNPLIVIQSALYGTPLITAVDVTNIVQTIFDAQYETDSEIGVFSLKGISPALFGISDPASGQKKTFTVSYTLPAGRGGIVFERGGQDGDSLSLVVDISKTVDVLGAFYGTGDFGLNLTNKISAYFADPGNNLSLTVGNDQFFRLFCGKLDPAPGTRKFFGISFRSPLASHVVHLAGYDGQTIDVTNNYIPPNQTWMWDLCTANPGFFDLPLGQLCLPATHDSGVYELSSTFTPDTSPAIQDIMSVLKTVTEKIDVIPYISKFINPADWAYDNIIGVTKDVSIATKASIDQQLKDGIRCLDLRIFYNDNDLENPFYTYHGLLGVPLSSILSSVFHFISSLAPEGEIVYVTMGHNLSPSGEGGFTPDQVAQLSTLVWNQFNDLDQVFGPGDLPTDTDRLFQCTYGTIIGCTGSNLSKVILVAKTLNEPSNGQSKVWAIKEYSPPDGGGSKKEGNGKYFIGEFTDTDMSANMFQHQQTNSLTAKDYELPFALYLTLTPQKKTITILVASHLRSSILAASSWAALVPGIGTIVSKGLAGVALYLTGLIANSTAKYSSIRQLSNNIFDSQSPTVEMVIMNKLTGNQYTPPTFIYMDFYENHIKQNITGQSVAQLVETSQKICLANLAKISY